jgi:hypothetical protein
MFCQYFFPRLSYFLIQWSTLYNKGIGSLQVGPRLFNVGVEKSREGPLVGPCAQEMEIQVPLLGRLGDPLLPAVRVLRDGEAVIWHQHPIGIPLGHYRLLLDELRLKLLCTCPVPAPT